MSKPAEVKKHAFDRPGTYYIRVIGSLDESWSERLSGMRISTESRDNQEPVTTLFGSVPDQAALSGVLETLYNMHLPLLSVKMVEGDKSNRE